MERDKGLRDLGGLDLEAGTGFEAGDWDLTGRGGDLGIRLVDIRARERKGKTCM